MNRHLNDISYYLGSLAWNSQALGNVTQFTIDADGDISTIQKRDYNDAVIEEITFSYFPEGVVSSENLSGKKKLKSMVTTQLNLV